MVSLASPLRSSGMSRDILRLLGDVIRAKPWPFTGLLFIIVVGNTRLGLIVAALGGLTQAFIDKDRQDAITWALVFLGAGLVEQVYWPLRNHMRSILVDHASLRIQRRVLARAADVPLEAFEDGPFFARLQRANDNLGQHIGNVVARLQDVLQVTIMFASVLVPLWLIHPYIVCFLIAGCLPSFITNYRTARVVHEAVRQHATADRHTDRLAEVLVNRNAGAELRLFGNGPMLVGRWMDARLQIARAVLGAERTRLRGALLGEAAIAIGIGLTVLFVVRLLLDERATLGSWVAVVLGIEFTIQMVAGLAIVARSVREEGAYLGDLFDFEELADQYTDASDGPLDHSTGIPSGNGPMALSMNGASFNYPGSERRVVDDVTLDIAPGEHIAIVGENGAGKSTLVRLLTGLYTPTSGTVTQDGIDTRSASVLALRKDIGAVFQDFVAWQLPIRDNVGFGDVHRLDNDDALGEALRKADLDDLVATLPEGVDTWLGREFGERDLSGGQWQRMAIARAFFRDARFLVLDEPTAALDPLAEQRLFERFRDLATGRTALTISHRLGPARNADRILVMSGGRIIESGTHDTLMDRNGLYAEMFRAQSGWYK